MRSGRGGALKAPLRIFALKHLILELHYCALGTFPKKYFNTVIGGQYLVVRGSQNLKLTWFS